MHSLHHNRVIMFSELIKPISRYFLTGLVFFMFSVGSLYLRTCTIGVLRTSLTTTLTSCISYKTNGEL